MSARCLRQASPIASTASFRELLQGVRRAALGRGTRFVSGPSLNSAASQEALRRFSSSVTCSRRSMASVVEMQRLSTSVSNPSSAHFQLTKVSVSAMQLPRSRPKCWRCANLRHGACCTQACPQRRSWNVRPDLCGSERLSILVGSVISPTPGGATTTGWRTSRNAGESAYCQCANGARL